MRVSLRLARAMTVISGSRFVCLALFVGFVVATFGAKPAAGQVSEGIILTINQVNDAGYPTVEVFASVSDQAGKPLLGLSESDFELFQDGQAVSDFQIGPVSEGNEAIAIVLAMDTSGSMTRLDESGQTVLEVAQVAALSFVNSLEIRRDQVALVSFNSEVRLVQAFSSDFALLEEAVRGLSAEGETRLNDAAYDAVELTAGLPPGRKAVVVLTDGQDTESRLTLEDAKDRAQQLNIPIYIVAFGPEIDPRPLERIARLTGGRYLEAQETVDIGSSFQTIADQLHAQIGISFVADAIADGSRHDVGLRVSYQGVSSQGVRSFVARPNPASASIDTPAPGAKIAGANVISPTYQMPGSVAQVAFLVDGLLEEVVTAPPYTYLWDSTGVNIGQHLLEVKVTDHVGNEAEGASLVTVVSPLTVNLAQPEDGQELADSALIAVEVEESFYGVSQVEFYLDGELIETVDSAPYEMFLDPGITTPGLHEISIAVLDIEGNRVEKSVSVFVQATRELLSAQLGGVADGQRVSGSVRLDVTLDAAEIDVERVEFLQGNIVFAVVSEAPYEAYWETDSLEPGDYVLSARVHGMQGNLWEDSVSVVVPAAQTGIDWQSIVAYGAILLAVALLILLLVRRWIRSRRLAGALATPGVGLPAGSSVKPEELVQEHPVGDLIDPFEGRLVERLRRLDTVPFESAPAPEMSEGGDSEEATATETGNLGTGKRPGPDSRARFPAYFIATHRPTGRVVEYPLREGDNLVGRSKDVDIMLPDTKVSRRHARVRFRDGRFLLIDLGATNPTLINGEILIEPRQIMDGDEVVMGETEMVFRLSDL